VYTNNDLLFPTHVIPKIREQRGTKWRDLIDRVKDRDNADPHKLAFVLMMIRLNGCMECETDSYRAMRGCTACALQTLRRYKPSDDELLKHYDKALVDVKQHLEESAGDRRIA